MEQTRTEPRAAERAEGHMSLGEAAAVFRKSKKTLLRWAQVDRLVEVYGRGSNGLIERAIPVAWVRRTMAIRGIPGEPRYEPLEVLEDVQVRVPGVPASGTTTGAPPLATGVGAPEEGEGGFSFVPALVAAHPALELFERMQALAREHDERVREFHDENRKYQRLLARTIEEHQKTNALNARAIRRAQRLQFLLAAAAAAGIVAGIVLAVRLAAYLRDERGRADLGLRQAVEQGLAAQGSALRGELERVREENQRLLEAARDSARTGDAIREDLGSLKERLDGGAGTRPDRPPHPQGPQPPPR